MNKFRKSKYSNFAKIIYHYIRRWFIKMNMKKNQRKSKLIKIFDFQFTSTINWLLNYYCNLLQYYC
jgi:hypothetical protein